MEKFIIYRPCILIVAFNQNTRLPAILARFQHDPSEKDLVELIEANGNDHTGFTRIQAQDMEVSTLRD